MLEIRTIGKQQSGGLLLPPVQTLVATIIFAKGQNANESPAGHPKTLPLRWEEFYSRIRTGNVEGGLDKNKSVVCNCHYCNTARTLGGKNIRTCSQTLINDDLHIDLPADTYMHFLQGGISGHKIKYLLITHSHRDHLYPAELPSRRALWDEMGAGRRCL